MIVFIYFLCFNESATCCKSSSRIEEARNEINKQENETLKLLILHGNKTEVMPFRNQLFGEDDLMYLKKKSEYYHLHLNRTSEIFKMEIQLNQTLDALFIVTSTTVRPGFEKYFDYNHTTTTTTTTYRPRFKGEVLETYLQKKTEVFKNILKNARAIEVTKNVSRNLLFTDDYFG